ncbi:lipid droplet-associated hydrolase-like [Dermacentor albipictus]|uniref:lipid droplet-associated hydrolase-like n=1 Tax=Dermacentor albipictus TaxID=60249 RepID=UPI0031FD6F20
MEKGGAASECGASSDVAAAAQQQRGEDVPMHFVSVNKVPTQVICYGDPGSLASDAAKPVVLVIPGNPGSIEFYAEFMREIYQGLKGKVIVWGVSHAGHVAPPKPMQIPNVEDHPTLYSCDGQIGHKMAFIKQYIPSGTPLILVGHSIGCHMVLEILKRAPDLNVRKAFLLFPAIESLDACPRVGLINPLITYLRPLTVATLSALRLLPRSVQNLLIRFYIYIATACTTPHRTSLNGAQNYFRPECLMACFVFTRDIIQNVRERDDATIGRHADKLVVYYGRNDHWSPVEYYDDLRRTFPEADVRLCDRGFRHAFVLDRSVDVGSMVRGWMEPLLLS